MAEGRRPGRRAGPLQGDTPEAAELAKWVCAVTKKLTLRELEERFQYGRTQWGQFRKGSKVLPSWLVDDLVILVKPPARQVQLQLGRRLQKAAEAAAVAREAQGGSVPMGTEVELQLRLDEARKATIEAQKTLFGTTQVIYMLLHLVTSLQSRCEALEREKERVPGPTAASDRVEQELVETEQKVVLAKQKLKRARETREEAEDLNVAAELTAARHELALENARAASPEAPEGTDGLAEKTSSATADSDSVMEGLRPLWEYDADLEAVDHQLDIHEAGLDVLRSRVDSAPPGTRKPDLSKVVVHDDGADNDSQAGSGTATHRVGASDGELATAVEEPIPLKVRPWGQPDSAFTRPSGAPRDVSEVERPALGRLCLGALYVPEVDGVRLHFGLLNGKPVGLIAEIGDYQFELRLRLGTRDKGSWNSLHAYLAFKELAKGGTVIDWTEHDELLPGWGRSAATRYRIPSTGEAGEHQYQVIVTGCDGPGWALQLTCFRPVEFAGTPQEHNAFRLIRAVLSNTVIDARGRLEAGHYILERPASRLVSSRFAGKVQLPPVAETSAGRPGHRESALSADSADNASASSNPVRSPSADKTINKQPFVSAPGWVVVKDTAACLAMLLWTGSLAAGLTYRREAETNFFWDGVFTHLWFAFLILVSGAVFLAVMAIGNFTSTGQGNPRDPRGASCAVIMLTGWLILLSALLAAINPDLLPVMGDWGAKLSKTVFV